MRLVVTMSIVLFTVGCAHLPQVKLPGIAASAPKDNGTAATANDNTTTSTIVVPAGSTVKAPTGATGGMAGVVQAPPIEAVLSHDSELRVISHALAASTGTIDTKVAEHRLDNEARQPLLYVSVLAAIAAGVMMYLKYPTPALMCAGAAIVFFLAWQMANLPSWMSFVGVGGLVGAVFLYLGHERGEKTAAVQQPPPTP